MNPPLAVIAGTGHHGSGYTARVLQESGIRTGHEEYYSFHVAPQELIIDSSWLSTAKLDEFDGIIWHQVRDPLKVVTSFSTTMHHYVDNQYGNLRRSLMRPMTGDPLTDSMATYVDLNSIAEQYAERRWRVEDVDAGLVVELAQRVGTTVPKEMAERAISAVSRKTNQHTRATSLGWDDLPEVGVKDELREMADRYGY